MVKISFATDNYIVTYDLSPCEVSAEEIADNSESNFLVKIVTQDSSTKKETKYQLPNTTLLTKLDYSKIKTEFEKALKKASKEKGTSEEKITKLFIAKLADKIGYIENN